jgi:hypothetical protein
LFRLVSASTLHQNQPRATAAAAAATIGATDISATYEEHGGDTVGYGTIGTLGDVSASETATPEPSDVADVDDLESDKDNEKTCMDLVVGTVFA